MSRQARDWLGRAVSPVRERWRASPTRPAAPPFSAASATSEASDDSERSAELRAGALFGQAVQRDPLPPERLMAIGERLRSHAKRRRAAPPRLVVRLAAGLSLLIVGGALAATASRYFDLPLPFGRPSHPSPRSPAPARHPHAGPRPGQEVGQAAPSDPSGQLRNPSKEAGKDASKDGSKIVQPPSGSPARSVRLFPRVERPVGIAAEGHVSAGRSVATRERQQRPAPLSAPPPHPEPVVSGPPALPRPSTEPLAPDAAPLAPPAPSASPPPTPGQLAPVVSPAPARPAPTALAEESALVMSALTALRRQDDPGRALAILDRHDQRFPRGDLADEAALARVEALLKMKRSQEALALLEARGPIRRGSSQRKLVLTRAELRAASGRCAAALGDLDALLRGAPPADALTERALWERAACRASGGQADAARADLQSYLRLFPSGQFARGARAALEGQGRGLPPPKP